MLKNILEKNLKKSVQLSQEELRVGLRKLGSTDVYEQGPGDSKTKECGCPQGESQAGNYEEFLRQSRF